MDRPLGPEHSTESINGSELGGLPVSFLAFQEGQAILFSVTNLLQSEVWTKSVVFSDMPFLNEILQSPRTQTETPLVRDGHPRAGPFMWASTLFPHSPLPTPARNCQVVLFVVFY